MRSVLTYCLKRGLLLLLVLLFLVRTAEAQSKSAASSESPLKVEAPKAPKEIFRDSDGNLVSNNEFVDIRMANYHYPDATIKRTLEDGTIEFRLQKIPQEGAAAPLLSARTVDGAGVTPEDLKGKVVVLNFWFIGCPACIYETPRLNMLAAKYRDNTDVIFLALTADAENAVKKYLAREKFDYRVISDAAPLLKSFGFGGYPKNIVIGKNGRIVYWRSTVKAWEKFDSVIRAELEK